MDLPRPAQPRSAGPSHDAGLYRGIAAALAEPEPLLVDAEIVLDPRIDRLTHREVERFWGAFERQDPEGLTAAEAGQRLQFTDGLSSLLRHVARSTPTLLAAYQALATSFPLIVSDGQLGIDLDRQLRVSPTHGALRSRRTLSLFTLRALLRATDTLASPAAPSRVMVAHPRPGDAACAALERCFGAPVRWDAADDALCFPRSAGGQPLRFGDPSLQRLLADVTRDKLRELDEQASSAVAAPEWPAPSAAQDLEPQSMHLEVSGRWFEPPGGERIDCARRVVMRRLLVALAEHHRDAPAACLSAEALLERGWPGERMQPDSGRLRVHVMLSRMRELGLRGVLQTVDGGYRLDPAVSVYFAD